MKDLSENILKYYWDNIDDLPNEKRFHFANRLYSWNQNSAAEKELDRQKNDFVNDRGIGELLEVTPDKNMSNYNARLEYFNKYSLLYGLSLALFKIRHLLFIFRIDKRQELLNIVPIGEIKKLRDELLADDNAIMTLSTHAVNYDYLVSDILFPDAFDDKPDVEQYLGLYSKFQLDNPEQIRMLFYLWTHCIIADSNFYNKQVNSARLASYHKMLNVLDKLAQTNTENMSLDTKIEFLVCCQLCGFSPKSKRLILNECAKSISPDGIFLIDIHNIFAGKKNSFAASEHRNVLFIMTQTDREPSST